MSGCYRCGLPDGSESRLCDTCFTYKFHTGRLVLTSSERAETATGIELTPRMQRWLLSSGAVAYLAVVSLGLVVQNDRAELRRAHVALEVGHEDVLLIGGNGYPVKHRSEFGFLAGPDGEAVSD
jgi:hypothetical protein